MAKAGKKSAREILKGDYDAIVIGSGFGASVAITKLADAGHSVLVLERGTWWRNPEGPAERDPSPYPKYEILGKWQYWPRPNTSKGLNYLLDSVYKEVPSVWDILNPLIKDRDLGFKKNRKGLYRMTRFEHENGNVDVITGSGVGGGSLFYSGVNLVPERDVLNRIGLNHLKADDFDRAGRWMLDYRGRINKVFTTVPTPHWAGTESELRPDKGHPKSKALAPDYEMLHRDPTDTDHEDYLYLPRARTLKRAVESAAGDFKKEGACTTGWHPLPLSIVEMDRNPWYKSDKPEQLAAIPQLSNDKTALARSLKASDKKVKLVDSSKLEPGGPINQEISLLLGAEAGPFEIIKLKSRIGTNEFDVERGAWHSNPHDHPKGTKVWRIFRGESDAKNTFCLRESRCCLGCLPSARHTLYKTIQKLSQKLDEQRCDPKNKGKKIGRIEVLPLSKVSHVVPVKGGGYEVHFEMFLKGSTGWKKKRAPRVFFGAGVLGTVEILLRSQEKGLPLAKPLGQGFSTNGDIFGFAKKVDRYEKDGKTEKSARDRKKVNATVGPINSSGVNYHYATEQIHVNLEDTGVPPMLAQFTAALEPGLGDLKTTFKLARAAFRSLVLGTNPFDTVESPNTEAREQPEYMTSRELLSDLFFFTGMGAGPKEPLGKFSLDDDGSGLKLAYPGRRQLHNWGVFKKAITTMKTLATHMNTREKDFVLSPLWTHKDKKRVTVVHPLGGCVTGANRNEASCNADGQLFDANGTDEYGVLPGLHVVDASVIPGALGVNPTYTIVTQAIRTVDHALTEMSPAATVGV